MVRGREGDCVYMGLCGAGEEDAGETRRLLAAAQALRHTSGTLAVQSQSKGSVACMGVNKWGCLADHAQELQQARKLPLAPETTTVVRGMCSSSLVSRSPSIPNPPPSISSSIPPPRPLLPVRHSTSNLPPAGLDVGRFPATRPHC